jgi:integrase
MDLVPATSQALTIGQLANEYAASNVFKEYQQKISTNTLKRQKDDIALFSQFLKHVGMVKDNLMVDCAEWQGITYGLVETFKRWQVDQGYAIASINAHLSTVKVYAGLAVQAGVLSTEDYALMKLVKSYRHKEGRNVDEKREQTRRPDAKKSEAVPISPEQAKALKGEQNNTPQGRRDALLMCLLLDHGLRCGEVAVLTVESLNLSTGLLTFYRQKVDKIQTHQLTRDTLLAAMRYLEICKPVGSLLMGSRRGGNLEGRMSERAITDRVRELGERIGVKGLSAHDCRHDWAKSAVKESDIKSLQQAGGWSSPAMPLRYADDAKIANEGIKLTR